MCQEAQVEAYAESSGYKSTIPIPMQTGFPLDSLRASTEEFWQEFCLNDISRRLLVNQKKPLGERDQFK